MSFKEYQLRNIKSKSFTASTALVPLNRPRDERNMMLVPYGYKPNYRLRHATNSSFIESMKNVEIERRTQSSPRLMSNIVQKLNASDESFGLKVNCTSGFAGQTSTIDESAEEFIHELSSNESPKHTPKSKTNDIVSSNSSDVGNGQGSKSKTDSTSMKDITAENAINVKHCDLTSSAEVCKNSFEGKTGNNKFSCACKFSLVFPLFSSLLLLPFLLNVYASAFPYPSCFLSRKELLSNLKSSDAVHAMKLNVIGQNDLIDNVTSTLVEFLEYSDCQNGDVMMVYIYGRSGVGKTFTVQTVLRHLGVDPFCVGTLSHNSNLSLPLFGTSFFHWDYVDVSINDNIYITQTMANLGEWKHLLQYIPNSVADYISRRTVIFVTSTQAPERNLKQFWERSKLLNSFSSYAWNTFEAQHLSKDDVSLCIDAELKSRFPNGTENLLTTLKTKVLNEIDFDDDNFSLSGCRTVKNLVTLLMSE